MDLIEVRHAIKTYQTGEDSFNALDDVSLKVKKGEYVRLWEHPVPANLLL